MKRNLLSLLLIVLVASAFAQTPSYVPSDGLVGWWPFNGDAADESGNGNNGTVNGATPTTDRNGVENAAYSFDGVDDRIEIPHSSSLNVSSVSISGWINPDDLLTPSGFGPTILSKRESSGWGASVQMNIGGHTFWADWTIGGNGGIYHTDMSEQLINYNTDAHFVYVHNESEVRLYLNGLLVEEINSPGLLGFNSLPLWFGARPNAGGSSQFFNGKIDDIGIWNRALTDEEILDLYNGCAITPTAIVGEGTPLNFTTANYFCNDNPGSTFTWEVSNGIISSGQGTNSIVVLWGNEGTGTVSVVETNAEGCDGPTASFDVNVQCSSNISSITGNLSPVVLTSTSYTVNGPADSEYQWTVTNGVITSGQGTTSVNVIWAAEGEGTLSVIETTNTGCESPVLTITTNAVITSVLEEKQSVLSIYPNPVNDQLIIVSQQNLLGQNYQLIDAFGRVVMQGVINNSSTTLNTQALSAGMYFLVIDNVVNKIEKLN